MADALTVATRNGASAYTCRGGAGELGAIRRTVDGVRVFAVAAGILARYRDELRAYADDQASVADIRAHLLTVAGMRDEAAVALEETRRLLAARGSSPSGWGLRLGCLASSATAPARPLGANDENQRQRREPRPPAQRKPKRSHSPSVFGPTGTTTDRRS